MFEDQDLHEERFTSKFVISIKEPLGTCPVYSTGSLCMIFLVY